MNWNTKKQNIHKIIVIVFVLFLICQYFFTIFSIRNNQGSFDRIRKERTFCTGIDYVSYVDDHVYALNRLSQILVYDENGNWQGYYQLPYSFGGYSMYTYDDYVCFSDMTVPGNIYQYDYKGFAYQVLSDDGEEEEKADTWMNSKVWAENGNTFVLDGFRTKLYMIKPDGTKQLLIEETWTDYLLYSSILKVTTVLLIMLTAMIWLIQELRMRRKYNKIIKTKADPVRIVEEIGENQEEIIWQGTPASKVGINYKIIILIIWSVVWSGGSITMFIQLLSITKLIAVFLFFIGCTPWITVYYEWMDKKMTDYFITDKRVIKCIKGKEFRQLFYDNFHHASMISQKNSSFIWLCKSSIVFAKHEPGYKVFTYGEFGDMHELSFDDISDAEHIVEMINQQREKYLQKYPEGAVYEKN